MLYNLESGCQITIKAKRYENAHFLAKRHNIVPAIKPEFSKNAYVNRNRIRVKKAVSITNGEKKKKRKEYECG